MRPTRRADTMEQNRNRLISAARKAFAEKGFAASSMDDLTAAAGLTRGALYHNFGDKKGLLAAVIDQLDGEMVSRAKAAGAAAATDWDRLLAEGRAYIEMALDPEVQRIVLRDGPAFLGDPSQWPGQNACLQETIQAVRKMLADHSLKPVDAEAAARLINGAAMNAALWVAASEEASLTLPKALAAFELLLSGLRR